MIEVHVDDARAAPMSQRHTQRLSSVSSDPICVRLRGGEDDPALFSQPRKDPRMGARHRQNGRNPEAADDTRKELLNL
jgi:hypothetical protein